MTDLISRADAKKAVYLLGKRPQINEIWDCLDALPSADTVSREHHDMEIKELKHQIKDQADTVQGEWVRKVKEYNDCDGHRVVYWYECDQCGARPPKDTWKNEWHSNFCPSCGARMVKESEE